MEISSLNVSLSMKMAKFQSYQKQAQESEQSEKVQEESNKNKNTAFDANKAANEIMEGYYKEYSLEISIQTKDNVNEQAETFNLADIGYNGKPIADLTQDEAKELVSEDGFFGIKKTSQRIADFVLNGAGDDVDKLKAGREGILRGFKEAEKLWGGKLPDISYDTIDKAVEMIDKKLAELGESVIDTSA